MDVRFPIGKLKVEEEITQSMLEAWMTEIEKTPSLVRKAVRDLTDEQLDTPYREGGWTVRQVVHHIVDSHVNSYIRLKLALTEAKPTIKPYQEDKWAELSDSTLPVEVSLVFLDALHSRWVSLLHGLTPEQLERTFVHPESGESSIKEMIGLYAWHGRHHTAHITSLREKQNW
jgi:uncharacterized damage-inducible protein DinB